MNEQNKNNFLMYYERLKIEYNKGGGLNED